jgi:hypothetical protein
MGIIILVMLAWALYSAIRAVVVFIMPRMRAKLATRTPAASMPNEPNWAELETPTFIRRGLAFPVLTEKTKRVRKKIQVAA